MRTLQKLKPADVGVLSKVLRIFEAIQDSPSPLHLRDICQQTDINKTTAYRFLSHLQREGYLFRNESGNYSFGMKLLQLAARRDPRAVLQETARSALRQLWKETQETVNFAVLDEGVVLYVDVIESPHVFRLASKIGMRRPIYSTALGILDLQNFQALTPHTITRVEQLKEELKKVRQRGYSIDEEESVLGARCVAAPVLDHNQEPVAAVSVSGPCSRIGPDKIPEFVAAVRSACRAISNSIVGGANPSSSKNKNRRHH